jgi:hypothetical protein
MNVIDKIAAYTPRTAPYAHQAKALDRLLTRNVYAILAEMGTGKSKMICDEWGIRASDVNSKIKNLLIIAPNGSYRNWWDPEYGEFVKHMPRLFLSQVNIMPWRSNGGVKWKREFDAFMKDTRPRAFVVNIEAMSTVARCIEAVKQFLANGDAIFVIDESTRIRSPSAKRTRNIMKCAPLAPVRRILTGLVAPNSPLDIWSQFNFLSWRILGHESYYTFRNRYAITQMDTIYTKGGIPRRILRVVGYRNEEELKQLLSYHSYRVLKEDCLDLPPKIYMKYEVELTAEQQRIYNEMKALATSEVADGVHMTATQMISRILRLHQVTAGHAVTEDDTIVDVPENRSRAILELLSEAEGKVIIWFGYKHSIKRLAEKIATAKDEDGNIIYGQEAVAQYHGDNVSTRDQEVAKWKSDPKCRFLLATEESGGLGNNWQEASLVIYHNNKWDLEYRMQSEDRAHRAGQTKSVTYVDLVTPGTVDEKIIKALRKKIDMTSAITGDTYRQWLI